MTHLTSLRCRPLIRRILVLVPLVIVLLGAPAVMAQRTVQAPPPPPDALAQMNEAVDALTKKVWPSVVQILVTGYGAREQSRTRRCQCRSSAANGRSGRVS